MKKILLILSVFISIQQVIAQAFEKENNYIQPVSQSDSVKTVQKQFHSYWGITTPTLTNLNNSLKASNYPTFSNMHFAIALAFTEISKKNIVLQHELGASIQSNSNDSVFANLRSTYISQSLLGIAYASEKNFQMYSTIGFTYVTSVLKIMKEVTDGTDFTNYSGVLGNQVEMKTQNIMLNLTTNVNCLFHLPKMDNRLIIGLKLGYYMPFDKLKWTTGKTTLSNSPNINPLNFAAQANVGFTF
jgi:hypothetical protein